MKHTGILVISETKGVFQWFKTGAQLQAARPKLEGRTVYFSHASGEDRRDFIGFYEEKPKKI
jgi:hypothetical protein